MDVEISRALLDDILADVALDSAHERCGLLLGLDGTEITAFVPVANVHPEPARHFELAPRILIEAQRRQREGGAHILGHYHSHPGGVSIPSEVDAEMAAADGRLWLIIGKEGPRLWQSVAGGVHLGRFNPLNLKVTLSSP